jgi:hypothetical protein
MGYAKGCPRLPKDRACDAVRFAVARESGESISVHFVFEINHLPGGNGLLEYDRLRKNWTARHPEPRIQKLAERFLQAHLERRSSTLTFTPSS